MWVINATYNSAIISGIIIIVVTCTFVTSQFWTLSFCLLGILAGLAIWQTVYAFTFTDPAGDNSEFYEVYSKLSVTINCVFYVVLVFCTVATFDR